MKNKTQVLLIALGASGMALAAPISISPVPVMNMTGVVPIPPNLMLVYDDSGSMAYTATPDYVDDNMCRSTTLFKNGQTACKPGFPPYMAPAFNRQYYNPQTRYDPPVRHNYSVSDATTAYPPQNATNTATWTAVTMDGFAKNTTAGAYGSSSGATYNLINVFPDLKWCDPGNTSDCRTNASYAYPNSTYSKATGITVNPYYYNIKAGEYCKDESLKECKSVELGSAAPTGYPIKAEVRWCKALADTEVPNNTAAAVDLGNPTCQAQYTSTYKYPRFSVASTQNGYGTITVGASNTNNSLTIAKVEVKNGASTTTITATAVTAATGTTTGAAQQQIATSLASSINGSSTSPQYIACVKSPTGVTSPIVNACSTYGIALAADNVVAVIPAICSGAKPTACSPLVDGTSAGYTLVPASTVRVITAASPASPAIPPTGLVTVTGNSANTNSAASQTRLTSLSYNGTDFTGFPLKFAKNRTATQMAAAIVSTIGTSGAVKAYVGGNAITPTCAGKAATIVCLVDASGTVNGRSVGVGTVTNPASAGFVGTAGVGYQAGGAAVSEVSDSIPTTGSTITTGSISPSPFVRVDITTGNNYPKHVDRTDCGGDTAGFCSYAEEMTNFANWWSYYRTRNQAMKTGLGRGFSGVSEAYRVGLVTISRASAGSSIDIKPTEFNAAARLAWYTKLYGINGSGVTPLRGALGGVGKMFRNESPYNYASGNEVIEFPCQQNFVMLTTDGYWNESGYSGTVTNNDNTENEARFCSQAKGCVDRVASPVEAPSLSDVTLFWYNGGTNGTTVSLRPDIDDITKTGLVPSNADDPNTHLHITTFTMGLGVNGYVAYEKDYDTKTRVGGDFYNIIQAKSTSCPWNGGGAYTWPDPQNNNQKNVDDLWHAAINGHGKYFAANSGKDIQEGFQSALGSMQVREGAASAASTSTPNVSKTDNSIFSATFTTSKWYGELYAQNIDVATGVVTPDILWKESDLLGQKVGNSSDTRTIYWLKNGLLTPFTNDDLTSTEQAWFSNKCSAWTQCTTATAAQVAIANDSENLVNWLRGQQGYADNVVFRAYSKSSNITATPIVLGDIDNAKPAYLRNSRKAYGFGNYVGFKATNESRTPVVFAAANDGMLHAFNATTGDEIWAYMPRITMPKLYKLANNDYGTNHQYTVDGSPEIADVQISNQWRTVLVAGLNAGGRGYYAIDVTDPAAPIGLWELCADSAMCAKNDPNIGLTYGNPQFGTFNGEWVVFLTSGYNNISDTDFAAGNGGGYLYIVRVSDGTIIKKVATGAGDADTPSGLARITAISGNPQTDPLITAVYGGDNLGNLWRFDLTAPPAVTVTKLAALGASQPITSRPEVALCSAGGTLQKTILFGTGRLLGTPDTNNTDNQTVYVFKDTNQLTDLRGAGMTKLQLSAGGMQGTYTIASQGVDLATADGWYMDLDQNSGERINIDPKVYFGSVDMVSNIPVANTDCNIGGISNTYQLDMCKGKAITSDNVVGQLLSNTSAAVGFITVRLPSGAIKKISTTADGKKVTTGVKTLGSQSARKSGWRKVRH